MSGKRTRVRRRDEPTWVPPGAVQAIHAEQILTHGGLPRLRDPSSLESALDRARNKWGYGETDTLAALAAAYAWGIARNHPFADGNKRTAFLTMVVFLGLNDIEFDAPEVEVVTIFVALAAGRLTEAELADWIARHI